MVYPPVQLYQPKPIPGPPVDSGKRMTVRQLSQWVSDLLTWAGEVCADREAIGIAIEKSKEAIKNQPGKTSP